MFRARKASHDEAQPCPFKLSAHSKHQPFLFPSSSTQRTSQRWHPHRPETEAAHAHHHANQNRQEDSAGKTRAHAQTTPSLATLTTATAMMLHLLAVPQRPANAIDIVIARPDATGGETAIVLDPREETTAIDTEMEATGDARLDVMEEAEMRGKRRGRTISLETRRRRRSLSLLLRPVVRSL